MGMVPQASSGYGSIFQTPLNRVDYADEIIAKWYATDFLPEITNTRIAERITACTQEIQFLHAPTVGEWRTYQELQPMHASTVSIAGDCIRVANLAYNAVKFDENTIRQACTQWDMFEEAFMTDMYQKLVKLLRDWVMVGMIAECTPYNSGHRAGVHGTIDLGSPDQPINITNQNMAAELAKLQQVLMDQLAWKEGEMFLVLPPAFLPPYYSSNYANAAWASGQSKISTAITGALNHQLVGFNPIQTTECIYGVNGAGKPYYYLIAGHREAFAFAADILQARLVTDPYTFAVMYQVLAGWGGKALYPQSIAVMVASFDVV